LYSLNLLIRSLNNLPRNLHSHRNHPLQSPRLNTPSRTIPLTPSNRFTEYELLGCGERIQGDTGDCVAGRAYEDLRRCRVKEYRLVDLLVSHNTKEVG
jgi:hypothetical protein